MAEVIAILGDPTRHGKEMESIAIDASNRGHIAIIPFTMWPIDENNKLTRSFAMRERLEMTRAWAKKVNQLVTFVIVVNIDGYISPDMESAIAVMQGHSMLFVEELNEEKD